MKHDEPSTFLDAGCPGWNCTCSYAFSCDENHIGCYFETLLSNIWSHTCQVKSTGKLLKEDTSFQLFCDSVTVFVHLPAVNEPNVLVNVHVSEHPVEYSLTYFRLCRSNLEQMGGLLKFYLATAGKFINMLVYTSSEVAAPMLVPEMVDRVANMLNYFLKHLTGSERAKLKVKNPEKVSPIQSWIHELYSSPFQSQFFVTSCNIKGMCSSWWDIFSFTKYNTDLQQATEEPRVCRSQVTLPSLSRALCQKL